MEMPADAPRKGISGRQHRCHFSPLSLFTVERFRYRLRPHACYNFPMDYELPKVTLPKLSTLVTDPPAGGRLATRDQVRRVPAALSQVQGAVDCFTRRGHRWSDKFSALAESVRRLAADGLAGSGDARPCMSGILRLRSALPRWQGFPSRRPGETQGDTLRDDRRG